MKKLICIIGISTSLSLYSKEILSLKDLANQKVVDQILSYPTLTAEQKNNFNNNLRPGEALSFKNQNLDFLNLSGIKLWGVDFSEANLNGINFYKSDLRNCNFRKAICKNINFREADLRGVDFAGAHFENTKFQGVQLTDSLIVPYYCETIEILKLYSKLQNEEDKKVLNDLIGTGTFNFQKQVIKNLNLRGINLRNYNFEYTEIHDCDLTDAQLDDNLRDCDFYNVKLADNFILNQVKSFCGLDKVYESLETTQEQKKILVKMILHQSSYSEASLFEGFVVPKYYVHEDLVIWYHENPKDRQNLNRLFDILSLSLLKVDLKNLDLTDINLTIADIKGANFSGSTLFEGFVVPEYIIDRDLVIWYHENPKDRKNLNRLFDILSLNLEGVDLKNLDLTDINLTRADIKGVNFSGSTLFEGFVVPEYIIDRDLVIWYHENSKDRKNLNRLFDILSLNLEGVDLKNLDLNRMNLTKAKIANAQLSGTTLFDGFMVPEYKNDKDPIYSKDLVEKYSDLEDPLIRRNLNRFFDIFSLRLSHSDLSNLELEGINLTKAECNRTEFKGSNLINHIYDDNKTFWRVKLGRTKWSEDFIFPSDLSEEELEEIYPKIAQTERQKYYFKQSCKFMNYTDLYKHLNFLDEKQTDQ